MGPFSPGGSVRLGLSPRALLLSWPTFCLTSKESFCTVSYTISACSSPKHSSDISPNPLAKPGGVFTCRWSQCFLELVSFEDLIAHISKEHIGSGKSAYYCDWQGCGQSKPFRKRHKMSNHMRTHTGERPFACTKKGCEKRFSRLDSLNTHERTHSNVRPFACQTLGCNRAYFHSRSLRKHLKSHVANDKLNSQRSECTTDTISPFTRPEGS